MNSKRGAKMHQKYLIFLYSTLLFLLLIFQPLSSFAATPSELININLLEKVYGSMPSRTLNYYQNLGQDVLGLYKKSGESILNVTENSIDQQASILSAISDFFHKLFNKPKTNSSSLLTILLSPNATSTKNVNLLIKKNQPTATSTTVTKNNTSIQYILSGVTESELNSKLANLDQTLRSLIFSQLKSSSGGTVINNFNSYITGGYIGTMDGPSNFDINNINTRIDQIVNNGVNPFDQDLNTTDSPTFNNITATGNVTATAFFGDGSNLTGITSFSTSTTRSVFSATSPLSYNSSTGNFSVASGFNIPLTASTTDWQSFFTTPSSRITAGTGLSWSGNTLNATSTFGTVNSGTAGQVAYYASTGTAVSGTSTLFFANGNVGIGTTTPSSLLTVAGNGLFTGTLSASNLSGTNTGNVTLAGENYLSIAGQVITAIAVDLSGTNATGILAAGRFPALSGDVTTSAGSLATTLATVNGNVGSFGSSTAIPSFTVNAKGLITAASTNAVIAPAGTLTGTTLASNVVNSSLTSLGTITSFNATNATTTNLFATSSSFINLIATNATSTNLAATNFNLGGSVFTSLLGAGLTNSGGSLTLSTAGDWTGTFDTHEGTYYLDRANHTGTQLASTISDFASTARGLFSSTATGLTYTSGTGVFSLTSGYNIPLTASTTDWQSFFTTPSSRITAGTGLSWSGNTLNTTGAFLSGGTNGYVARWTSPTSLSTGLLLDNATVAGINATSSSYTFNIQGTSGVNPFNIASSTGMALFTILNNGNVGIGTTNPNSILDIGGLSTPRTPSVSSTGNQLRIAAGGSEGTGNGAQLQLGSFGTGAGVIFQAYQAASGSEDVDFLLNLNRDGPSAAPEVLRIKGATGNVGIGTTTPGFKLTVAGTSNFTNTLNFNGASGSLGNVLQSNGSGSAPSWVATSTLGITSSQWITSGSNIYYNTGNVGIGTTTPTEKLEVNGAIKVSGTAAAASANSGTIAYSTGAMIFIADGPDTSTNSNIRFYSQRSNGSNSIEALTILGSGNVGIGDSSPASLLTVGSGDLFQVNSSGNIVKINNVTTSFPSSQGAANTLLQNDGSGNLSWVATSTLGITSSQWITSGSNIYYSAGKVGVGAAPTHYLDVQVDTNGTLAGRINNSNGGASANARLIFGNDNADNATYISLNSEANNSLGGPDSLNIVNAQGIIALNVGGTEGLRILNSGLIGIGTTSPVATIDIFSHAILGQDIFAISSSTNSRLLTVTRAGNLGIGSSTPGSLLTVAGTSSVRNVLPETNLTYDLGSSAQRFNQAWIGTLNVGTSTWSLTQSANGRFSLFDAASGGGTERLSILSNGNVGIGITDPAYKLTIKGSGTTTGSALRILNSAGASVFWVQDDGTVNSTNIGGINTGDQDLSGLVPYSGASSNVDLLASGHGLSTAWTRSGVYNIGDQGGGTFTIGDGTDPYEIYIVDAQSSDFAINLPNPSSVHGQIFKFKTNDPTYTATLTAVNGEDIDGSGSYDLSDQYSAVSLVVDPNSNNWKILTFGASAGGGVPYTGATGDVDLNNHSLTGYGLIGRTPLSSIAGPTTFAPSHGGVLDDVTITGTTISGNVGDAYRVVVDIPDFNNTWKWYLNGSLQASGLAMTIGTTPLADGISVNFSTDTGHDVDDTWESTTVASDPLVTQDSSGTYKGIRVTSDGKTRFDHDISVQGDLYLRATSTFSTIYGILHADANSNYYFSNNLPSSGVGNVAIGYNTLSNPVNSGTTNIAIGYSTLAANTTGGSNIALGQNSLGNNTSANNNTAIGANSLSSNQTGAANTAVGYTALSNNVSGSSNVAIGAQTLFNSTGSNNIGIGNAAGTNLTSGAGNVAIGNQVLFASTTASNQLNISNFVYGTGMSGFGILMSPGKIGFGTSSPIATLSVTGTSTNNLFAVASSTGAQLFNILASGKVGVGSSTPVYTFSVNGTAGFTGLSTSGVGDTYVCLSTAGELRTGATCAASAQRFKTNVVSLDHGLDWIESLRPVTFDWKYNGQPSLGFIAEEVDQVSPLLSIRQDGQIFSVNYQLISAVLTKAVQELNNKVNDQNASTTAAISSLNLRVQSLEELGLGTNADNTELGSGILAALQSFGSEMLNSISYVTHFFTKFLTVGSPEHRMGVTLYDQATGEPYCLAIRNGQTFTTAGECQDVTASSTSPVITPPADGGGGVVEPPPSEGGDSSASSTPPVSENPPTPTPPPEETSIPPAEVPPAPAPETSPPPAPASDSPSQ